MDRNLISQRQIDALKLEALRAYFDFRGGRPTAESVADKLGIPVRTVREWFGDNHCFCQVKGGPFDKRKEGQFGSRPCTLIIENRAV